MIVFSYPCPRRSRNRLTEYVTDVVFVKYNYSLRVDVLGGRVQWWVLTRSGEGSASRLVVTLSVQSSETGRFVMHSWKGRLEAVMFCVLRDRLLPSLCGMGGTPRDRDGCAAVSRAVETLAGGGCFKTAACECELTVDCDVVCCSSCQSEAERDTPGWGSS